jgi:hypothetical protein
MTPPRIALCAVLITALSVTGCTSVHTGQAIKDPAVGANAAIPALLDPGTFPTTPQPPLGTASDYTQGAVVEAHRLGDNTVLPFQVDPTLHVPDSYVSGPLLKLPPIVIDIPAEVATVFNRHTLVAGFGAGASPPGSRLDDQGLINLVLRMPSPQEASAAVADLAAHTTSIWMGSEAPAAPTSPVPMPAHPETAAITYRGPFATYVWAFTARGPFVLAQSAATPGGPDPAVALVTKTLDQQLPLIDAFTPTPLDALTTLPVDPTGVLARTIPIPDGMQVASGSFSPHAALALQSDPQHSQKVFSDTGVDVMTNGATTVYRARDDAGAAAIVGEFTEELRTHQFTPAPGVIGLPAARCLLSPQGDLQSTPRTTYCVATTGRYAFEATGTNDALVRQLVAAQYLMLTAP